MNNKYTISLVSLLILSCYSEKIVKSEGYYSLYSIYGYISSRKDSLSLDISIKVNKREKIYSIEGYDTLLGKKRFILIIENNRWAIIDEKGDYYKIDFNDEIFNILPNPLIFNYILFLEGRAPSFSNPDKIEDKEKFKVYYKNDNKQIIYYSADKIDFFEIYKEEKLVFKFEYKGYIEIKNPEGLMIFPKIMYIYDYQNKKRIEWWFDKIEFEK